MLVVSSSKLISSDDDAEITPIKKKYYPYFMVI